MSEEEKAIEEIKKWLNYNKVQETILNLISNLQKELDIKDKVIDYLAEKLEEKSKSMTKEKWKIVAYNQVEKVGGEDE